MMDISVCECWYILRVCVTVSVLMVPYLKFKPFLPHTGKDGMLLCSKFSLCPQHIQYIVADSPRNYSEFCIWVGWRVGYGPGLKLGDGSEWLEVRRSLNCLKYPNQDAKEHRCRYLTCSSSNLAFLLIGLDWIDTF